MTTAVEAPAISRSSGVGDSGPLATAPVFLRRHFFDSDECRHLCAELEHARGRASSVVRAGIDRVDERLRRTRTVDAPAEVRAEVGARLAALEGELAAYFRVPLSRSQAPVFLRYSVGDFFRPHVDRSSDPRQPLAVQSRRVTAVVFLNSSLSDGAPADDHSYSGGELVLYRLERPATWANFAATVPGEAGLLIAFDSSVEHEVAPVTSGVRFSIATWFE